MNATIENNFRYHTPQPGQPQKYEALRSKAKELAYLIEEVCPAGREKALAMTNLEQSVMWANAAIAREPSNVPGDVQQAEYRCCLKAGMSHQGALEHMRRSYPNFVPEAV